MELVDYPLGSCCFPQINTPDAEEGQRFYGGLFGWTAPELPAAAGGHAFFRLRGENVAGLHLTNTGTHFVVADFRAGISRATALGGSLVLGPRDAPNLGRFADLADAMGAVFAIMEPLRAGRSDGGARS